MHPIAILLAALVALWEPRDLKVGPGCEFDRPEPALAAAHPGDTIELVAPSGGELVLKGVALKVTTPVTIRATGRVILDGGAYDYSGAGSIPRAIIQIDRAGKGTIVDGLILRNAHNESGNGAAIRINAADSVTIRHCDISTCDMGVMSNGSAGEANGQRFESCDIHHNGSPCMKGLSHNLYLGGEDVTLDHCTIHDSTQGHNLKSRARSLHAVGCRITNSAEREVDLVDSELTGERADASFEDCDITKRQNTTGNRAVIHFGQDGGHPRSGLLTIKNCRVRTYYISPVVTLSSPGARCLIEACSIENKDQQHADLIAITQGDPAGRASGSKNSLSHCYDAAQLAPPPK